jgi:gliding motility associated protien GldN
MMKLRAKLIFSFACLMVSVMGADVMAQGATSVQPSSNGDRQFKVDTVYSAHPIRDDDKMYQMAVWRRIDLREKFNLPLYGSGDIKDDGIMTHIYNAVVEENALEVFRDEKFTQPMSISEFQENFWIAANGDSIFVKQLYYLDLMEDFVFDKHHSQVKFDVKYLELVMPSETNSNAGQTTIAFIRFKDFYDHFKDHPEAKWLNFKNTSKHLTYDQAFDLRLFKSVVRKFYNPENALIADQVNPNSINPALQAYLNSLEFEYGLLEWENTLWEW